MRSMEPHPQMNICFLDVSGLTPEEIEKLEDLLDPENAKSQEAVELPWELECVRPVLQPLVSNNDNLTSQYPSGESCLAEPLLYTHLAPPPYTPPEVQFYPPYLFGVPQFVSVKSPFWNNNGGKGGRRKNKYVSANAAPHWDEEPSYIPFEVPPFLTQPHFTFSPYPQQLVYMPVSYPLVPLPQPTPTAEDDPADIKPGEMVADSWPWSSLDIKKAPPVVSANSAYIATSDFIPVSEHE